MRDARSPPTTRTRAPGIFGATARNPKTTASETSADDQRGHTGPSEGAEPRAQLLERIRTGGTRARQLGKLADDHVDGRTEEESGHHGTREELSDPPHLEHGENQEQDTGGERDGSHEGCHVCCPGNLGGHDGACRHCRQSRTRPGRDLAASPEDRVEDRAGRGGVETVLQRDSRYARITEVLRNNQCGHGDPGDQISLGATGGRTCGAIRPWGQGATDYAPLPRAPPSRANSTPNLFAGIGWVHTRNRANSRFSHGKGAELKWAATSLIPRVGQHLCGTIRLGRPSDEAVAVEIATRFAVRERGSPRRDSRMSVVSILTVVARYRRGTMNRLTKATPGFWSTLPAGSRSVTITATLRWPRALPLTT